MKKIPFLLLLLLGLVQQGFAQIDDEAIDTSTVQNTDSRKEREPFEPKNFIIGSVVNFAFNNNGIGGELSPYVGYRIFDMLAVGVGGGYAFNSAFGGNYSLYGYNFRAFGRLRPVREGLFSTVYFAGEYQWLINSFPVSTTSNRRNVRRGVATNVGLGITSNFSEGWSYFTEVMYDFSYDNYSSMRGTPLTVRFGFQYGF